MVATEQIVLAITSGLIFGSLLALSAVGLSLIFGVLEVPNFAQGEFAVLGGFVVVALEPYVGLPVSIVGAILVTFVAGVLTEKILIARFYGRGEAFFLQTFFATFAVTIISQNVLLKLTGGVNYQIGVPDLGSVIILGVDINTMRLLAGVIAVAILFGLYVFTRRTYLGLAMRAVADDNQGAAYVGIDRNRLYMLTFAVGAMLTGVTGILYGSLFSLYSGLGVELTAFAFLIVVIGGVGSFYGTFVASLLIGLIDSFTAFFIGSRYRLFAVFFVLMLTLIMRPTGLGGEVE